MRRLLLFILILPQIAFAGYEDGAPDELPAVGQPSSQVSPVRKPGPPAAIPPVDRPQPVRPPVGSPAPPTQSPNGYPTAFQPPAPTRPTPLQSPPPTRPPVGTPPTRPSVGTGTTPVGGPASPIQSLNGRNTTYQPPAPTRPTPLPPPPPVRPPPTRPPVGTPPTRSPVGTPPTRPSVGTGTTPIGSPASPTQSPIGSTTTYQPPAPTQPTPTQSPPPIPPQPTQPPVETGTMPDGVGQSPPSNPAFEACIQTNPRTFCQQIIWWDGNSREQDAVLLSPVGFVAASPFALTLQASEVFSEPTERYQCLSIQCICQFARGRYSNNRCVLPDGQVYGKAYRKEFRMMTDDERYRFRNAMWAIRTTQYLDLSRLHASYVSSPAAHSGPAFLPWHREFIKRLEVALRQYDPTVSVPYWDSTLDARLDDPTASVLWDDELMGSTDSDGTLSSGLFAYWQAHLDHTTRRSLGTAPYSRLTAQERLDNVNQQYRVNQVMAFSAASNACPRDQYPPRDAVEFIHGSNHIWIGGDMNVTTRATNDPIFFLHHCMIDNIWENWRLARQSRAQRQNDYPTDNIYCSSQSHFARSIMVPFSPMVNIEGLSNDYTDNLYSYAPRPSCSRYNRDCGSRYLFCHGTLFVCVSRIRAPFACDPARYGGVDPCYGQCVNGRCVAPLRGAAGPPMAGAPPQEVPIEQDESCYNQNPCCASWADRGGCTQDPSRMKLICPASCRICTPQTPISDDCTDRHPLCSDYASAGRCTSSVNFMAENCRRTCNLCGTPRSAGCASRRLL